MDIGGTINPAHGHPGGIGGGGAVPKAGELDIWSDPPFHYHVMRY
jgi:hypothetical protein